MADVNCALCAESWDSYDNFGDMERHEAKLFRQGKGCPACDFGRRMPIHIGQTFAPVSGGAMNVEFYTSDYYKLHIGGGPVTDYTEIIAPITVQEMDHDYRPQGRYRTMIHITPADDASAMGWYVLEEEFRRWFVLVPSSDDHQRADDVALRACEMALSASDEEPFGLMEERGMF